MRGRAPRRGAVPALLTLLAFLAGAHAAIAAGRRTVAIGDVHGAYEPLRDILLAAGLVDAEGHWAGGDTVLVQTGDFLDRGAGSLRVAHWLMRLQREAPESGGEVIVLLGNHEIMNLMGDVRYVTPEMVEPLVDEASIRRREVTCKQRAAILRRDARALGERPPPASAVRRACVEAHPLGLIEYVAAMRPEEPLGRWLRSLPATARVGHAVFLHGGLRPELAGTGLDAINEGVWRELATFESWREWLVENEKIVPAATLSEVARAVRVELELWRRDPASVDPSAPRDLARFFELSDSPLLRQDGPLWFRGYHDWTEEEGNAAMPRVLAALGARHVVVGHTPRQRGRIQSRFDGRVFMIDTGMLADYYGGAPAALQFVDDRVEAIYLDDTVVLEEAPARPRLASEPG